MDKKIMGLIAIVGAGLVAYFFLKNGKTFTSNNPPELATNQAPVTPIITTPTIVTPNITHTENIVYAPSNINAPVTTTTISNITQPTMTSVESTSARLQNPTAYKLLDNIKEQLTQKGTFSAMDAIKSIRSR